MKTNKDLVLTLIQADLKHHQLLNGLKSINLETESYFLELYKVVAHLMGVGEKVPDQWLAIYDSYVEAASKQQLTNATNNLLPVAEECYCLLQALGKIEQRLEA